MQLSTMLRLLSSAQLCARAVILSLRLSSATILFSRLWTTGRASDIKETFGFYAAVSWLPHYFTPQFQKCLVKELIEMEESFTAKPIVSLLS